MAGLDMQIFYDFVSHQRNRPPVAVKALPDWATPTGFSAIMDPAESSRHLVSHFAAATDLYPVSRASSVASSVEQADGVERPERLQGDLSPGLAVERLVDDAHPAFPEDTDDLESASADDPGPRALSGHARGA